jgi:hypothetical protein
MKLPAATPSMTGTAQTLRIAMSTAPLARCALKERIEVGMMIASEVPTHKRHADFLRHADDAEDWHS